MTTVETLFGDSEYGDWHYALYMANHGCYGTDRDLPAKLGLSGVLAAEEGENDGANWVAVFTMTNGRFAFMSAGCDYTGWDCQAGGSIAYADTLQELCRMHMGEDHRQRLGFDVNGERVPEVKS